MAKYRPLLIRMISRLDANTPEARQSVYASLRAAFVALMGPQDASPTSVEKYDRERRELEDAIAAVESSMIDGGEDPTASSVSSDELTSSPINFSTDQKQPFKDTPNSSTIFGTTLDTSALSSANYHRSWYLFRQSWQSFRMR
jgi:hypothetical protein